MRPERYWLRFRAPRLSPWRMLRPALLAVAILMAAVALGCDSEEAEPVVEATPQETEAATTPEETAAAATPEEGEVLTFDSDGVPIHYEVFGEGRPIILLHGFASDLETNWVETGWVDTLSATRQVIAMDARGHGLSGKPHDAADYDAKANKMTDDVLRLMDHLGIEQADLFGYSMGSAMSLQLLLSDPERFNSVVMGGVGDEFTGWREASNEAIAEGLLAEDPSTITNPIAAAFRAFAESYGNDLEALAACMLSMLEPVEKADLNQVDLPVLIVDADPDIVVGSPDGIAEAIPGARLVKIPDTDHISVVPDDRFKEAVVEFLAEVSPP